MINCMILSHVIFFVFGAAVVAGDAPSGLGVVGNQQAGDRPASPVPKQHEFHEEYGGAGDVEMLLMRVPQSSEDAEEDAQQAKGWSWMEAQQACIDAGGAALVNLEDPRHSTMQPLAPLMANETAIAWVGAVYIHAGTTQESVSSSRPSNGWMWVTAVDQAGQGAPDEHQSSLQVVQRLPWAPGFPRLLGKDHVNLQSTGQIKSCVAMRWVPRWGPVFQNLDCSSQVPRYLVCQKPAARQPLHDGPIESTGWSVRGMMSSVDGLLGPNAIALLIVVAMCAAFAVVNAREAAAARSAAAARGGSRGRAASDGSGASLEMRKAAAAAAAARAAAAATTAAAAAAPPIEADPAVLQAMRAFGVEVTAMQDYLHFHPQKILDALRLLHSTTDILIQNQATNPNGAAQPFRIKATLFQDRTHGVPHSYEGLLMLGFKEVVQDMVKFLEFRGRFHGDVDKNMAFLTKASSRLETAMESVQTHMQMNRPKYQTTSEHREAALAAIREEIDADRASRRARKQAGQTSNSGQNQGAGSAGVSGDAQTTSENAE